MRRLKLIWDFRGPDAFKIAQHHVKHLDEYAFAKAITNPITGNKEINSLYAIAFIVVDEQEMRIVRDALKPHRGELYKD